MYTSFAEVCLSSLFFLFTTVNTKSNFNRTLESPRYVQKALNEATGSHCLPIEEPSCLGLEYTHTYLPNIIGLTSQAESAKRIRDYGPLVKLGCSTYLEFFLCSVYFPMCTESMGEQVLLRPCASFCNHVRQRCAPLMLRFNFPWPEELNCSKLPTDDEMCIKPHSFESDTHLSLPSVFSTGDTIRDIDGALESNSSFTGVFDIKQEIARYCLIACGSLNALFCLVSMALKPYVNLILTVGSKKLLRPNDEISAKVAISDIVWTKEIANWMQYLKQIPPEDRKSSILIGRRHFHVPPGHDGSPMIKEPDRTKTTTSMPSSLLYIYVETFLLIDCGCDVTLNLTSDVACLHSDCNYIQGLKITVTPYQSRYTCYVEGLELNLRCEILPKGIIRLACSDTKSFVLKEKIVIVLREASGCESRNEIMLPPCAASPSGVQLTSAGGSMTCFWKSPSGTPPAKYRVWINNSAGAYLLGEQEPSQLFAFIPSMDLESDTPYSCLVEACSELGDCSPRAQSPIARSDKRQLPVPIGVRLVYESGGFLRCYWKHPAKTDIPLVHYRTFLYAGGRKKEIRPPTDAQKTAIDFIKEKVKFNRNYSCEIVACYRENRGRLVCSGASSKSTIKTPVQRRCNSLPAARFCATLIRKDESESLSLERPKPIEKHVAKVNSPNELIVTWEVPKDPPGVMVNYTATIVDESHNMPTPCSVEHQDLASTLSCKIKNIPDLNEYRLSVIGCIAPNSDGNGGGCSPPSVRTYHRNVRDRPLPPSNVSAMEIGAGQLEVNFQVDEKFQGSEVYFLVKAEVENRTVALCRTSLVSLTHSCTLEGLNSSVNYTIIVHSCNAVNGSLKDLCSAPSDPVFASVMISGRGLN
ncbi:Frizzled-9 [Taenia crassiceps]|uniref:Frizzled-9 n=1 Tax=Taenia crassiceps TaxID=6207 RepID=A0ABR4QDJ5_9CEST